MFLSAPRYCCSTRKACISVRHDRCTISIISDFNDGQRRSTGFCPLGVVPMMIISIRCYVIFILQLCMTKEEGEENEKGRGGGKEEVWRRISMLRQWTDRDKMTKFKLHNGHVQKVCHCQKLSQQQRILVVSMMVIEDTYS